MKRFFLLVLFLSSSTWSFAQKKNLDSLKRDAVASKDSLITKVKDSLKIDSLRVYSESKPSLLDSLEKDSIQKRPLTNSEKRRQKRLLFRKKDTLKERPVFTYKKYKFISYKRDTTYLDTSLTIHKYYKFNYLRRDMAGIMPFPNPGQVYTRLERGFTDSSVFLGFGAVAKHFNFEEKEDVLYYSMASPTSELFYKSSVNQGQMAEAWISINTSKQFNITWNYAGLRSLGKLKNILANNTKNLFSMNYRTKNERYLARFHFIDQNYNNQENGGISNEDEFEQEGNGAFEDRTKLNVHYSDANSILYGRRYFFDHRFMIFSRKQKGSSDFLIGHEYVFDNKSFAFNQSAPTRLYGDVFLSEQVNDKVIYQDEENSFFSEYSDDLVGKIKVRATLHNYKYSLGRAYYKKEGLIPNLISNQQWIASVQWKRIIIKNISFDFQTNHTLTDLFQGTSSQLILNYESKKRGFSLQTGALHKKNYPNLNTLLYQSKFINYNWANASKFNQQEVNSLFSKIKYKNLLDLEAEYSQLTNYTYFQNITDPKQTTDDSETFVNTRPIQHNQPINFLKIKASNEIKFWKFGLQNTIIYQSVNQNNEHILNLPQIVSRNSLYFFSDVFNKAMYLEFGVSLKYFSSYYTDAYNPLIGEYYNQTRKKIGDFPLLDVFASARVKQTRLFIMLEHFNSNFSDLSFYSAPRYPFRDLIFRFGLVWDFYM